MDQEKERLIRLLSQASQELGEETVIEEVLNETVRESGKLGEKIEGSVEKNGSLHDYKRFKRRFYDCGCIAKNLNPGAKCYKGHLPCSNHSYRCLRCRRSVCIKCLESINGVVFCRWCSVIRKITPVRIVIITLIILSAAIFFFIKRGMR